MAGQSGRGTTHTASSITAPLAIQPQAGDILIAVIGLACTQPNERTVSSMGTSGNFSVTWYGPEASNTGGSTYDEDVEIWIGIVNSSSSGSWNVIANLSGIPNEGGTLDVYEYSGVATSSFLDLTGSNTGTGTSSDTGTTGTTNQANELWIGAVIAESIGQNAGSGKNGFTMYDGVQTTQESTAFLEKIVSAKAAANSGTTLGTSDAWTGCIATFKAAAGGTAYSKTCSEILGLVDSQGPRTVKVGFAEILGLVDSFLSVHGVWGVLGAAGQWARAAKWTAREELPIDLRDALKAVKLYLQGKLGRN